jgi:hypothetical protein
MNENETPPPAPSPVETPKQRAARLRADLKKRREEPELRQVTITERAGDFPPGIRLDLTIDTRKKAYSLSFTPDSKEGAIGFLEIMRWSLNQVGVDFIITDYIAAKEKQKPTRLV